jgi:hypothetical protein
MWLEQDERDLEAPVLDLHDDRSHGLVGDTEVACHAPQSRKLSPGSNLRPPLPWNAWTFGRNGIPPNPRSSPYAQESARIQERDQGESENIYLA